MSHERTNQAPYRIESAWFERGLGRQQLTLELRNDRNEHCFVVVPIDRMTEWLVIPTAPPVEG